MRANRWVRVGLVALAAASGLVAVGGSSPADAALSDGVIRWNAIAPGGRYHWSSPVIADISGDGAGDVVVGGLDGRVHALGGNGAALPGFPAPAVVSGAPSAVASSPAVGDLDGNGSNEVVVGVGSLEVQDQHGGIVVLNGNGTRRCAVQTGDKFDQWSGGGPDGFSDGVFNAPALGDVNGDGRPEIVFGSWDHQIRVINGACQQMAIFDNTDTVWSSPALFDTDGDGRAEIFIGGDATSNGTSHSGGFFRALRYTGAPQLAQLWVRLSSETFQSKPAIGDINGDGRMEVVTGSGRYYCVTQGRCGDATKVWAFDLASGGDVPGWPRTARYDTFLSAPALGDVNGDGRSDVVIGSFRGARGAVLAVNGNGQPLWEVEPAADELLSSPIVADVWSTPGNEVVVGTGGRMHVLNGATGATVHSFGAGAFKSAAAVGELGADDWVLVAASFQPGSGNAGSLAAWDIPEPASAPWPIFGQGPTRDGVEPVGPLPTARPIDSACPAGGRVPASGITDVSPASPHRRAIECVAWWGLTQPVAGRYFPTSSVTRAQMASFLARLLDQTDIVLPTGAPDAFSDDEDPQFASHEENINRLAAAGVVAGRSSTTFAPDEPVTRGQMATFIVRTAELVTGEALAADRSWFRDRDPVHGTNVDRAASAGIATGFSNGTYRPGLDVRRDQMASFLARLLALVVDDGHATLPDQP